MFTFVHIFNLMKNYIVHFRRNAFLSVKEDVIKQEQQRLAELMHENILQQVYMSKNMDNLWMTFKIEHEEELREIIKTLPMCKDLYFEIHELLG